MFMFFKATEAIIDLIHIDSKRQVGATFVTIFTLHCALSHSTLRVLHPKHR